MLCVVEGCDGVGKTTLVKAMQQTMLQDGRLTTVLKAGQPLPGVHPLTEYAYPIVSSPGAHLICDRWHVGEQIYGPAYRGHSRLSWAQRAWLDALLIGRGALLVHVTASHDTVLERCRSRGEDFLKEKDIPQVLRAFAHHAVDNVHWRTVDTTDLPLSEVPVIATRLVDAAMSRYKAVAPVIGMSTDYAGPLRPRALLVADRPALGADALPAYGALTPWEGNSAAYLLDALYDVGVLQPMTVPQVGWVNSWKTDLQQLHRLLGHPPIIALGAEALGRLSALRLPVHGKVYHPQYQRRFKHGQREEYGQELAELIYSAPVPAR